VTDTDVAWYDLDQRAVEFARDQLHLGKGLAHACLPLLTSVQPKAHLPSDTPADRIAEFNRGGINAFLPRDQVLPAEALWRFLRGSEPVGQRVIVFEDPYARPTDPFITSGRAQTAMAILDDEVYQVIPPDRAGDSSQLPVAEFPIIGVASRERQTPSLHDRAHIDEGTIEQLAENAVAVLVGAWDAENYIVLDRVLVEDETV
jgi:hypothetical protein